MSLRHMTFRRIDRNVTGESPLARPKLSLFSYCSGDDCTISGNSSARRISGRMTNTFQVVLLPCPWVERIRPQANQCPLHQFQSVKSQWITQQLSNNPSSSSRRVLEQLQKPHSILSNSSNSSNSNRIVIHRHQRRMQVPEQRQGSRVEWEVQLIQVLHLLKRARRMQIEYGARAQLKNASVSKISGWDSVSQNVEILSRSRRIQCYARWKNNRSIVVLVLSVAESGRFPCPSFFVTLFF